MSFQLVGDRHQHAFQRETGKGDGVSAVADVTLSIVVPVKDEAEAIGPFLACTVPILESLDTVDSWEILFVDDGSIDATLPIIVSASHLDGRIKAISLSRNFGKEAALSAGLDYARGRAVIPIDVDMQDPPEAIAALVGRWQEGFEVVYGVRKDRRSDTMLKRWTSSLYYRFHNFVSEDRIPANAGDFRLLDRRVVDVIRMLPERNRFMKGIFAWSGFEQSSVEYTRDTRLIGKSKYSYWKLFTLAIDGITASSTVPLRMSSYVGGFIALVAFAYAAFIAVDTMIYGPAVNGYPSIISAVMFLGGIQLVSLGVLGEYVGRILIETKQRPLYVLRSSVGMEN